MADKRVNNGGAREGAGRKSKKEEQNLIEKLTPIDPIALRELQKAVKKGEKWAIELFFRYFYGLPTQVIDQTIKDETNYMIRIVKPKIEEDA